MRCEFFITVKNEALVLNVSTIPRLKLVPLVRRKVEGTNGMLLRNVLYPPSKPDGVMTQKTTYKIAFSKKKKMSIRVTSNYHPKALDLRF